MPLYLVLCVQMVNIGNKVNTCVDNSATRSAASNQFDNKFGVRVVCLD